MIFYNSRYKALKAKTDKNQIIVKVDGGNKKENYVIMDALQFKQWKNQK
jgi:hypothetical protein